MDGLAGEMAKCTSLFWKGGVNVEVWSEALVITRMCWEA